MDVKHVAKLANLSITPDEETKFSSQFTETLKTINLINELDTSKVAPTFQVTGLTNITRLDEVDTKRIIPKERVLAQAHQVYQDFIVVPRVFDE
jgi:aspartyl-tRNA(Asn)/glutamyl-tRNA(Gln) amidotransferase subunit C